MRLATPDLPNLKLLDSGRKPGPPRPAAPAAGLGGIPAAGGRVRPGLPARPVANAGNNDLGQPIPAGRALLAKYAAVVWWER
jgi:hypothetical protein